MILSIIMEVFKRLHQLFRHDYFEAFEDLLNKHKFSIIVQILMSCLNKKLLEINCSFSDSLYIMQAITELSVFTVFHGTRFPWL